MFVVVICLEPIFPNGGVNYSTEAVSGSYDVDTMATFLCTHGYSLSGSSSRTCQTSGNWEQPIPTCIQSILIFTRFMAILLCVM